LFFDSGYPIAGCRELSGVGEWAGEGLSGVVDFAAGEVDVGLGGGLAGFEAAEAVFQAGDKADGLGVGEFVFVDGDCGAGGVVEFEGDLEGAERAGDAGGYREAAQVTGAQGAGGAGFELGGFGEQQMGEVAAGVGAVGVLVAVDGHGELVAAGVGAAGDRGLDPGGELVQAGDVLFVAGDRVAEGGGVAVVGAFGSGQAG
jgi:hypothetical protein